MSIFSRNKIIATLTTALLLFVIPNFSNAQFEDFIGGQFSTLLLVVEEIHETGVVNGRKYARMETDFLHITYSFDQEQSCDVILVIPKTDEYVNLMIQNCNASYGKDGLNKWQTQNANAYYITYELISKIQDGRMIKHFLIYKSK